MRIHHLNCGTLLPLGGRRVNGSRLPFLSARMVCHCLLIETDERLVLVDSGFGLNDIARLSSLRAVIGTGPAPDRSDPIRRRLTRYAYSKFVTRARLDPAETAVRQVANRGHSPGDVTDIVLTHLDPDHAGGLPDFPDARIHVHEAERDFAMSAVTSKAGRVHRFRYWPCQWSHEPHWTTYSDSQCELWFGLQVQPLDELRDMALVALAGHSPGHCGVAIGTGDAASKDGSARPWLLHAGDAYFDHREIDPVSPHSTPGLASFQRRFEFDRAARHQNRARLRELAAGHRDQVEMFCSHDPVDFDRYGDRSHDHARDVLG